MTSLYKKFCKKKISTTINKKGDKMTINEIESEIKKYMSENGYLAVTITAKELKETDEQNFEIRVNTTKREF